MSAMCRNQLYNPDATVRINIDDSLVTVNISMADGNQPHTVSSVLLLGAALIGLEDFTLTTVSVVLLNGQQAQLSDIVTSGDRITTNSPVAND